jgi:isopenicillin-N epimerase
MTDDQIPSEPAAAPVTIDWARHWHIDFTITFLNHGSFGAVPVRVIKHQRDLQDQMEREPVRFFSRELPALLDRARGDAAHFVGANPKNFVFVPNATTGVNTVLRSLDFKPGDELLTTDHAYNACKNALDFVAQKSGARVVIARLPFPLSDPQEIVDAIVSYVTERTRIALLDHVTSATALILPMERIVAELEARGVETLVDGAHTPGMIPLDVEALGATYYTGNFHKWTCAPKGAAFLHVRDDRLETIRPLTISHGANVQQPGRSRFHSEFDWTGTQDFSPYLCVPEAIRFMRSIMPGGWPAIMERNRNLAIEARRMLIDRLGLEAPCPESMLGSMASLPYPDAPIAQPSPPVFPDPLQHMLFDDHGIEVLVSPWPAPAKRLLRISAQLYNTIDEYEQLVTALGG